MSLDLFAVLACCVLGLLAHGAKTQTWLGWVLRVIIGFCFVGEGLAVLGWSGGETESELGLVVMQVLCLLTGAVLFLPVRKGFSYAFTVVDSVVSGRVLIAAARKASPLRSFLAERVFVPESMPHLVALWIFVTVCAFLVANIDPGGFKMPSMPIPIPVPLDQLFSYNGLGLILLAFCGVGIFISRNWRETLKRLGLVKPTLPQVGIGVALVFVTFAYDAAWALVTHNMEGNLASKLAGYNAGTFSAGGGAAGSAILALATGLCAGIGEETLMRGALQAAFGILPAALLHGLLHGQFSHAPILILQVAGWSAIMGIVRRYTNTTTTIIGHAGFNFLTTFLFAFNP